MRTYRRVTYEDRCHIFAWMQEDVRISVISARLGLHKTTIYRELKRNSFYNYRPQRAHEYARSRYLMCRKNYRLNDHLKSFIKVKIIAGWSPEQISGRLMLEKKLKVSHECIYQYIRKNKKFFKPYMRKMKKTGAGRYLYKKNPRIDNLLKIKQRPVIANNRRRIGDWERDSMFGLAKKSILVMTDRKSRYLKMERTLDLKAETTNKTTSLIIQSTGRKAFSITNDRGPEFASPIERIKTYYCDPMSPYQRGTVENTIGLIRQYIKNHTNLELLGTDGIKDIENKLNFRPRKCLDFKTPYEIFFKTKVALAN